MLGQQSIEVLAFKLGQEHYGINILSVQEIRGYDNVTQIANTPDFIKGIVNLRGIIVPIVDMRIRFGQLNPEYDQTTVVIVLNLEDRVIGMVVDSVSDVIALDASQIKQPPEMGVMLDVSFLLGIASVDERTLMLLNIERLMATIALGVVDKAAA
ncbi:chemotaxis protein CheW [Methylobacillus gramineus]|uniref:chemotaxis protein CheW n=1 Tax=Methylobacillus gramineus TaxID=755169 RepID=UPI001CFFC59A|nr:chemotaxis protein CheW [Methylobacillus gramineus]MCB5186317.1 chemotaxis protein CheW [Methylobacillus gramineus]